MNFISMKSYINIVFINLNMQKIVSEYSQVNLSIKVDECVYNAMSVISEITMLYH